MASKKQLANLNTKAYVQSVFTNKLQEEGFACSDDNSLCWYRMSQQGVMNTITFFSPWTNIPVMLQLAYGIFPAFAEPITISNVYFPQRPIGDLERFSEQGIVEDHPLERMCYCCYSPEIHVLSPKYGGKGIYTFEQIILPKMDHIRTIEEAYYFHKKNRKEKASQFSTPPEALRFGILSRTFVEMAIYVSDTEMYPLCMARARDAVQQYERLALLKPRKRDFKEELACWKQVHEAFSGGDLDGYRRILDEREKMNIRKYSS